MLALYFHSSERGPHSSFAARQTPVGTTIEWHKRKAAGEPQDATCCVWRRHGGPRSAGDHVSGSRSLLWRSVDRGTP